jgi:chondroitin 4-sulfotransferase 11
MHGSMSDISNVSHKLRCIFVHIPKTAGTSIKKAFDMPGPGHWPWYYYAENYPELWRQYTTFAVVRNPWDRMVSAYRFAKMKNSYWHNALVAGPPLDYELLLHKSFEECLTMVDRQREQLKGESWFRQTDWVAGPKAPGGKVMVDRVLRLENLADDFRELCEHLGFEPPPLLKINRSKRSRDYREYYNDNTRKLVERLYASDIETFGYSF